MSRRWCVCLSLVIALLFSFVPDAFCEIPAQTDVDRAEHLTDAGGVPILKISGVGETRHPAWVAHYALAYAGIEAYDARLRGLRDERKFEACVRWLEENLKERPGGLWVWTYDFDSTYNDVSIKAPWSSAFAQAVGIQAMLAAYRKEGDRKYLDIAQKAARALFVPLEKGGFLFRKGNDVWFEEIPSSSANPSHILNGHMRVLLALRELAEETGDETIRSWFQRGSDTLLRWLPLFDAGYWLRYDLNPKKTDILFRFANPYGYPTRPVAIDRISLRDPTNGEEVVLDVGASGDAEGSSRIAGVHWGPIERIEGRSARRLVPAALDGDPDEFGAPHSYFYLRLPGKWNDNLRERPFELVVDYFDDGPANLTVQQRSIAPGPTFRDVRDGDLLLSGACRWRRWMVPVRTADLGYWVGESYAGKHAEYLESLAKEDRRFEYWARIAKRYLHANGGDAKNYTVVEKEPLRLPTQLPMLPIYFLDGNGVLMQCQADNNTKYMYDGSYDFKSSIGIPRYSPFIIAGQLLHGEQSPAAVACEDLKMGKIKIMSNDIIYNYKKINRHDALKWFMNKSNQIQKYDGVLFCFEFENVYNDVLTKNPWSSAFSQAYVLKALAYADENMDVHHEAVRTLMRGVANSFSVPVSSGGVSTTDRSGLPFFEEVPNATHVLNAHLVSVNELASAGWHLKDSAAAASSRKGILSLKEQLHLFDAGYWLRYDLNPKKELLVQFDWLDGDASPLVERILFCNPETMTATEILPGDFRAFEGSVRISGTDWLPALQVDDRSVRGFRNGYRINAKPLPGGTRHNVYAVLRLPESKFGDYFDVPEHLLTIRYKDVARGGFSVRIQAIHEGNVLTFVPLRGGAIRTTGDGRWKEAVIAVRPQDLGWYKGPDYQKYEVEQLRRIANLTNDLFFYQYAERHEAFLEAAARRTAVIPDPVATDPVVRSDDLAVRGGSSTYPGYGFENAIDGDALDDYVAGVEREQSASVTLEFARKTDLASVELVWENESNFARSVRVELLSGDLATDSRTMAEIVGSQTPPSTIPLDGANGVRTLRIEFRDFAGQQRLLLRLIRFRRMGSVSACPDDDDSVFLGAKDFRNSLRIFRKPVTMFMKRLSDRLSDKAGSDFEKILRFMDYITRFRVGFASDASPDAAVKERVGACGTYSGVLLALSAAQGINGRYVDFFNFPLEQGHTVCELSFGGKWRLFDPTFAAYYVSKSRGDRMPLSFEEIRDLYARTPDDVEIVAGTYRLGFEGYAGAGIFLNAEPFGVIGLDRPMFFPLSLTLGATERIRRDEFGTKYQGANFLGAAETNQNQRWTLRRLRPNAAYDFVLTPSWLGGDLARGDTTFALSADIRGGVFSGPSSHVFDFTGGAKKPWTIRFLATEPEVVLVLAHPYRGPEWRYVHFESYELRPAGGTGGDR